jgi:hypothetical protein
MLCLARGTRGVDDKLGTRWTVCVVCAKGHPNAACAEPSKFATTSARLAHNYAPSRRVPIRCPSMKRKRSPVSMDVDGSPKRARKEKANDEFRSVKASIVLAVPPVFTNRLHSGVEEMLDTMIMRCSTFLFLKTSAFHPFTLLLVPRRYEPTLNGVVLAHSNVHFLDRVARLQADSPFSICHVGFEALIWNPTRGMKLSASGHRVLLLAPCIDTLPRHQLDG